MQRMGYRVEPYHAAMSADHRLDVQRRFRSGELEAVVATVAFGMGIDKSNIRWIVHNNMPSCIESYYQEIGRAGRVISVTSGRRHEYVTLLAIKIRQL